MIYPIRLKTLYGSNLFDMMHNKMKEGSSLNLFKVKCKNDYDLVGLYFKFFLEDEQMKRKHRLDDEDTEGWRIFYELSDVSSCLRYFSGNYA